MIGPSFATAELMPIAILPKGLLIKGVKSQIRRNGFKVYINKLKFLSTETYMTSLTQTDIENFWIRCYLNPTINLTEAAIDRAYRDFNRTLHGIGKVQTKDIQGDLKNAIIKIVSELLTTNFNNQRDFDIWHETKCENLVKAYKDLANHKLYIGQAQKWINMSLKYLFALGDNRIKDISKNYKYFHFPIDNIIQDKLVKQNIPRLKISWSRIDNYADYLNYQERVRTKFSGQIPLDVEFKLFNE